LFNRAVKDGLVEKELYLFEKYCIKQNKTKILAISLEAIKRIEALEVDSEDSLNLTRYIFLVDSTFLDEHKF